MFILFTTINVPNGTKMKTRRASFPQATASSQIIEIKCRHQTQCVSYMGYCLCNCSSYYYQAIRKHSIDLPIPLHLRLSCTNRDMCRSTFVQNCACRLYQHSKLLIQHIRFVQAMEWLVGLLLVGLLFACHWWENSFSNSTHWSDIGKWVWNSNLPTTQSHFQLHVISRR